MKMKYCSGIRKGMREGQEYKAQEEGEKKGADHENLTKYVESELGGEGERPGAPSGVSPSFWV